MAANYPGTLPSFAVKADGVDWVLAAHQTAQEDEIVAIATELGTDVAGTEATLKARLTVVLDDDGTLKLSGIAEHTGIADDNIVEVDGSPNAAEIPVWTANGLDGKTYAELIALIRASGEIGIDDDDLLEVDGTPLDTEMAVFTPNGIDGKTYAELIALWRTAGVIGIDDDDILEVDGTPLSTEYARFTANGLEGRTEAEFKGDFNLEIGTDVLAEQTIGIADNNLVEMDSADAADDEIARFTANGLESRSNAEMKTQLAYMTDLVDDTTPTAGGNIDMNSLDIDNARSITFIAEVANGNSGTADTIDFGAGQKQSSNMTDDCTYTFTAPDGPCNLIFKLIQGAGFPHNPTWPASVLWEGGAEPTWSVGDGDEDIISFYYDGTNYYGSAGIGFA